MIDKANKKPQVVAVLPYCATMRLEFNAVYR